MKFQDDISNMNTYIRTSRNQYRSYGSTVDLECKERLQIDVSEATLLDSQNYIQRYSTPTCQSKVTISKGHPRDYRNSSPVIECKVIYFDF